MKIGNVVYETREVLAGAYAKQDSPSMLTHTVKYSVTLPGKETPLCSRVKADSICDGQSNIEGLEEPPTCETCRRRDPRFQLEGGR